LGGAFEELVVDLRSGFEAVAPRAADGTGVRVLRRMVEYRVGELVDLRVEDGIYGHSSYAVGW
jgi:hypothetical protein